MPGHTVSVMGGREKCKFTHVAAAIDRGACAIHNPGGTFTAGKDALDAYPTPVATVQVSLLTRTEKYPDFEVSAR